MIGGFWRTGIAAMLVVTAAAPAAARSILFVGNSFTFGAHSPVRAYRPDIVTDLNREGIGGVPAIFKTFAEQTHEDWKVSLETSPGKDLAFHLAEKSRQLAGKWDVVILQGYSTLDAARPGDPVNHARAAAALAAMFHKANAKARVELVSTWSRADLTYRSPSPWFGKPITAMANDLAAGNAYALRLSPEIAGAIPVGQAWSRAFARGFADANPYDGIEFGKIDLWTWDQYHASAAGYYLEALMIFGRVTGVDPRTLGENERAARDLGLSPGQARQLQAVASEELASARPLPAPTLAPR